MCDGPVLYAEDDENDVFFMTSAFAKLVPPIPLVVVRNGKEVADYLNSAVEANKRPRLLLLDLKLPLMSGLEVLGWIREQERFASLPIAMLTSSTEPYDLMYCRAKGANAYLEKTSQAALPQLIKKLIECAEISDPDERLALPENYLLKLA
jgi:two-component system response regulator